MQSKLSKLQKDILILVYQLGKDNFSHYLSHVEILDRWEGKQINCKDFKNPTVAYQKVGFILAKKYNKLIPGRKVPLRVKPSFSVSLTQSTASLQKRNLLRSYRKSKIYLGLTEEGVEHAKELLKETTNL